ncbi:TraB/GumN family protein [Winogradskyella tangerina]|uniref:TraB/GumN family protein n=1 Tax=Winogradskyella tangerina TaxID=2023240 RepID=UPI000DBE7CED|nr:TraB/GumN family protein [Winogradskyella tangerina]
MKRILSLSIVALLSIVATYAQKLENSTLWKIEGNGLEQPSYLFGTIHLTCDATIEADVQEALDQTSRIVLELDMDDPNMSLKMMKGTYLPDGQTAKDFVSEEDFVALDSLFTKNMGMSMKLISNVKPFFLTSMLYPKLIDCPMQSFELELIKIAKEQNEEIDGLETIEDQMKVFEDIPLEDQYADLVRMAKENLEYDKTLFAKMLDVYKSEDIESLLSIMDDESYQTVSDHQDVLLENRNKNWISKIEDYAKEEPTFFGVGAGHLAGENGVINLLRQAGYTVTAFEL